MKFLGLIRANLFRKKIRFILTIGSFAVALFLFGMLAVIRFAFSGGIEIAGADRLVVINRTSIIQPLPLAYANKIRRIPGVKELTYANWFGGVYQDAKQHPDVLLVIDDQRGDLRCCGGHLGPPSIRRSQLAGARLRRPRSSR